jgi:hypothetical protein
MKHLKRYPGLFPKEMNLQDFIKKDEIKTPMSFSISEINIIRKSLENSWVYYTDMDISPGKRILGRIDEPYEIYIEFKKKNVFYRVVIDKFDDEYFKLQILAGQNDDESDFYEARYFIADQMSEIIPFLEKVKKFYHSKKIRISEI